MANDPQTFNELSVAVLAWSARDDLDGNVEEFIALAERRLNASLFAQEASTTLTATTETVALPTDFGGVRTLWIDSPRNTLDAWPLDGLLQAYSVPGTPVAYSVVGSNMILGPEPTESTTLNLTYWKRIPALSDSNTTNWLLTARPDLYLSASLVELYLYTEDEGQATLWEQRTASKIAEVNRDWQRKRHAGPLVAKARAVA